MDTKRCPACTTEIRSDAVRCPHCRSRQPDASLHRGVPNKMIAGVCAALALRLGIDALWVRVAAVLLCAISVGAVLWVYVALWVVSPPAAGEKAPLEHAIDAISRLFTPAGSSPSGNPS